MTLSEFLYYGLGKGNSYGHVSRSKDHIKSISFPESVYRGWKHFQFQHTVEPNRFAAT